MSYVTTRNLSSLFDLIVNNLRSGKDDGVYELAINIRQRVYVLSLA